MSAPESLLNRAFTGTPAWRLLCPYDRAALDEDVVAEVYRSHPSVLEHGLHQPSPVYPKRRLRRLPAAAAPRVPRPVAQLIYGVDALAAVRRFVAEHAGRAELSPAWTADLVVAVNEIVTNSIRHATGRGTLRLWHDGDALICETRDDGCIRNPLVGRLRPTPEQTAGRGLRLVNRLCDLVQVRSSSTGTVVRLWMRQR